MVKNNDRYLKAAVSINMGTFLTLNTQVLLHGFVSF